MRLPFTTTTAMMMLTSVSAFTVLSSSPSSTPLSSSTFFVRKQFTTTASATKKYASTSAAAAAEDVTTTTTTTTTPSTITIPKLTIPPTMDEILSQTTNDIEECFENNVQKTYGRFPLSIIGGNGCTLVSSSGDEYLDFVSGIATCALGHNNTDLTAAITKQIATLHHISNLYYIPAQASLAQWIIENSFGTTEGKVFFCNSGAEANEAAIKCARKHAIETLGIRKPIILTAEQSFHGRTLATLSATGQTKYQAGFTYDNEMVPGFRYVPYNDVQALRNAVNDIDTKNGEGLAGIMMEAMQGEGGIIPGSHDFFTAIRSICDETNAFMICDEVQVGMGRTGTLWGYQNLLHTESGEIIEPDIFTCAKALGGGIPIGAMAANHKSCNVLSPGTHASTYGGNPLACTAGLTVATYLSKHDVLSNVHDRGVQLRLGLQNIQKEFPTVFGDVRGWGLLCGIECMDDNDRNVTVLDLLKTAMFDEQLLLIGAGSNMIRFVPPLIVTEKDIDAALSRFRAAILRTIKKKE